MKSDLEAEIYTWWKALDQSRGDRAKLRRCATVDSAYGIPSVHALHQILGGDLDKTCCLAIVLSHVKGTRPQPVPRQFAECLSKLRFEQLLQAHRTLDDTTRHFRRAIAVADGNVNLSSLASGVLFWNRRETRKNWAASYYQHKKRG